MFLNWCLTLALVTAYGVKGLWTVCVNLGVFETKSRIVQILCWVLKCDWQESFTITSKCFWKCVRAWFSQISSKLAFSTKILLLLVLGYRIALSQQLMTISHSAYHSSWILPGVTISLLSRLPCCVHVGANRLNVGKRQEAQPLED